MTLANLFSILKGGPKSGNFGHVGRLGKIGGSGPTISGEMAMRRLNNYSGEKIHILSQINREAFMKSLKGKSSTTTISRVNLSKVKSTQEGGVRKSTLKEMVSNYDESKAEDLPKVLTNGKDFLIEDGNHRLSAMKILGYQTALVELVTFE